MYVMENVVEFQKLLEFVKQRIVLSITNHLGNVIVVTASTGKFNQQSFPENKYTYVQQSLTLFHKNLEHLEILFLIQL